MTLRARTAYRDGWLAETGFGAIAVRRPGGGFEHEPDVESAVVVLTGAAQWRGGALGAGDGVYGPCRLSAADATLLLLHSRHPVPDHAGVEWRYAPAGREVDGNRLLEAEGGFSDMGVRWLVTTGSHGSRGIVVATSTFEPGGSHQLHRHPHADEFFLVLRGGGHHLTSDGPLRLDVGDLVYVPADEPHGFRTDPGTVTTALYGYLGAGSLDEAGYELDEDGAGG